ncbi:MAG: hypothetical protein EA385_10670 [Salinarimonadaceae bacterium]|nr:MAG: hypothetical protein EA385_10670 [Salinarimonadaceae bacterium]
MHPIPLPISTAPGARPAEGGGRLINCFAEKLSDGGPSDYAIRRSAGLERRFDTGPGGCRGRLEVNGALYLVQGERAFYVTTPGGGLFSVTDIGEVPGEGPVRLARNSVTPTPDVLAVTSQATYVLTPTNVTELDEPDLPPPVDVCFVGGYFMFATAGGLLYASDLNSTSVDALDFTRPDARADRLLRVIPYGGELFAFKSSSIQPYYNAGLPEGFPFAPRQMIPRGLLAPSAIAGDEPGWTDQLIWVGDDFAVYILEGYTPRAISTPDLERLIKAVPDKSDLRASVYRIGGAAYWVLSSPFWTWEFNLLTGLWNERKSAGSQRWKATGAVFAFGEWIATVCAEGVAYAISETAQTEGSDPLVWEVWSTQGATFPGRMAVPQASFLFVVGQGSAPGADPIQTNPRVSISWSDDGGVTFSSPLLRELGPQGKYRRQIRVNRTGLTGVHGRVWKLAVSDPVYVALLGGNIEPLPRAA